jgi:hypothetical protein
MNGDLRLSDGTPVRIIGEMPVGEWTPVKSHVMAKWDYVETDVYVDEISGSFTSADIQALMDKVHDHYTSSEEVYFYVYKRRYWDMQYASQGKRYPSLKKRKSKARMSKKWRDRA